MKRMAVTFCLLCIVSFIPAQTKEKIIQKGNDLFLSNTIIVKLKQTSINSEKIAESLNADLGQPVISNVRITFPVSTTLFKGSGSLQKIFYLTLTDKSDPIETAKQLSTLPGVQWAEPKYIRKVCYSPNDELFAAGMQPQLDIVKAKEAWEISKGNKNIVIGIIDTGVDINHPDLSANIYLNKNEIPGNGIDEDDSGEYIDDVHGWDFGGLKGIPDNDASEDYSYNKNAYHGTHAAGIASAVTDNSFGISSIGFNCTILPVKVSEDQFRDDHDFPLILFGYEGIKYAVDKGAKIINCSWGGYSYSNFEQEIIDYAISKGALVIASAGNDGSDKPYYPACYKGVLSVGWTNNNDTKFTASNYGKMIAVMAPGTDVYSTWPTISGQDPPFHYSGGSSMSAPLVSGLAGLIISKYPDLTVDKLRERIRVTCDKIDQSNPADYNYLLGAGRINAHNAVKESELHSLKATEVNYTQVLAGDTSAIEITFTNFLEPLTGATVIISCPEPFVKITSSTFETGFINKLGKVKTANNSFLFSLTDEAPFDTTIYFLLRYELPGYSDFQWIPVKINPSYITQNNGKITATVTNKGGLGFNGYGNGSIGEGFKYLSSNNLLTEGGLLYGASPGKLMDGIRIINEQSNDFKVLKTVSLINGDLENDSYSLMNDDNAGNSKLGILTRCYSYSFNSSPDDSYIILNFIMENTTQEEIKNLFTGYFLDWNMSPSNFNHDTTSFDMKDNFAYAYSPNQNNIVVGAALLSPQKLGYMGINNKWRVGEVILEDGFVDEEKWYSISNGIVNSGADGDISFVISGGPVNILPGSKEKFAFAIAAAQTKEELRQAIINSREKYNSLVNDILPVGQSLPQTIILYQNYPNPFNPSTVISYQLPVADMVTLKVYDVLGREVTTLVDGFQKAGIYHSAFSPQLMSGEALNSAFSSGVYFYRLTTGKYSSTRKMIMLK